MNAVTRLPRRRTRRSLGARLRTYWVVAVFAGFAGAYGIWLLANAPQFRVQSISVIGTARVRPADVLAQAAIAPSANAWLLDKRAIERRVERLPFVDRAQLHRTFPARVVIAVSERTPDGCLVIAPDAFTIDSGARVLARGCLDPTLPAFRRDDLALPTLGAFLHDETLTRLRADAAKLAESEPYRAFAFDSFGGFQAVLTDGITVRFGDDADLDEKAPLVAPILAELAPRLGRIAAIDLRAPAAPAVSYQ